MKIHEKELLLKVLQWMDTNLLIQKDYDIYHEVLELVRNNTDEFVQGYLCAVQNIAISEDRKDLALGIMRMAGFKKEEWLHAQRLSGYGNEEMNDLINTL